MSFRNLFIGAVTVLSLAACSKSNDANTGSAALTPNAVETPSTVGTYAVGTPNFTFNVVSGSLTSEGKPTDDTTFKGYPLLASQSAELATVNKIIATKENSLELWSTDSMLLAFDLRSGAPALVMSRSGSFQVESATWAMDNSGEGQGQGLSSGVLTINMRECLAEQKQEESKPVDQGKQGQDQGKPAPIDQGKKGFTSLIVGTEGQGQDQGKDQGKPVDQGKPAETCKTATFTYNVKEIEQAKPVDQGKQGQDQGKPAPIDQGKQGQDQAKPVDQGKPAPAPAPIDQGKKGQDQAKPVDQGKPAPIDQGKQGQDQAKPVDQGKPAPIDQGKKS